MNILAFDTCLDKMYAALGQDNKILASKIVETTKSYYHSAFLISTIANLLKENDLTPQDIDVIATNTGPGSFTGIRACTTVARVFAQGVNGTIKTVGVSSLKILSRINKEEKRKAREAVLLRKTAKLFTLNPSPFTLAALDARKEMAYIAIYEGRKEILAPKVILLDELKKLIAKNNYFIVTDDKLEPIIGGISYQKQGDDLGKYLIQIANEKINETCETDWRKLLPLYIQPPAINLK